MVSATPTLRRSWVTSANEPGADFPLNNLPYGVFSTHEREPRCGVAIGDRILDCRALAAANVLHVPHATFEAPAWNAFMALGPKAWQALRDRLTALLADGSDARETLEPQLVPLADATLHLPFTVTEYTDFYAGRHHASNVGTMLRGAENALPPNWLHMPIGYNGRASSVVVSGTPVRRPWGQLKSPEHERPAWLPSRRFDLELELGAVVGTPSDGPVSVGRAHEMIFGYVLLNDWSARDIQAWEYQPLGPFQAKATATSIGAWIVTAAALDPFRVAAPEREQALLPHLADTAPMNHDIDLAVSLAPAGGRAQLLSRTNARELYYSAAQQLAHHASSGCPMRTGDLLGSGTVSGPTPDSRGSLLELSWGGKEPIALDGGATRRFLEDGDTVTLHAQARADELTVGFGDCTGTVLPALDNPLSDGPPA